VNCQPLQMKRILEVSIRFHVTNGIKEIEGQFTKVRALPASPRKPFARANRTMAIGPSADWSRRASIGSCKFSLVMSYQASELSLVRYAQLRQMHAPDLTLCM
jgi:hypothetical protein